MVSLLPTSDRCWVKMTRKMAATLFILTCFDSLISCESRLSFYLLSLIKEASIKSKFVFQVVLKAFESQLIPSSLVNTQIFRY